MITEKNMPTKTEFETKEENLYYPGVWDVEVSEVHKKLSQVALIDVRQPEEFTGELGHVPNSRLIELGSLPSSLNELPKDKTIVFICRSGSRSAKAAAFAMENGITDVYNMKGGMLLWNQMHYNTEA